MKQTVTSKYEPKSKNVTWIDMSTGSPVQKNFINGMWRPTGGGGGAGSSNPTEADATKVWQVTPVQKGTKTEEIVIVPEQTLVDEQTLEYNDKFVPGAQCIAVIDGVEYRGEVINSKDRYKFEQDFGIFEYEPLSETFLFYNYTESPEVTAKLSVIEETPTYDYNWAPGVKIPVPTAEDEGKILVVTKVEGDNTSIIVPEQEVPADNQTPLTNVDLTKFVVGNTVKVTVTYEGKQGGEDSGGGKKGAKSANSQTLTATGVIEEDRMTGVRFYIQELDNNFHIVNIENSLRTNAFNLGLPNPTIKLEYLEQNYEYQLQENSGGSGSTSNVLWPAMYEYNESEIMATFVPEDVEPNTWCMICGKISGDSIDTCLPVLVKSYGSYAICNKTDNSLIVIEDSVDGGKLLRLSLGGGR